MNTYKNIQKVALVFFFAIGFVHIMAHLTSINGYIPELSYAAKRILEIPFILSAALYGLMSIKISFTTSEKDQKIGDIVMISIIIVLFAALIYLNLFIPDRF